MLDSTEKLNTFAITLFLFGLLVEYLGIHWNYNDLKGLGFLFISITTMFLTFEFSEYLLDKSIEKKNSKISNNKTVVNLIQMQLKDIQPFIDYILSEKEKHNMKLGYLELRDFIRQKIDFTETILAINLVIKELARSDKIMYRLLKDNKIEYGEYFVNKYLVNFTLPYFLKEQEKYSTIEEDQNKVQENRIRQMINQANSLK